MYEQTEKQEELSPKEKLVQYRELKKELLHSYHNYKEELSYAMDDFEEGIIKKKREKLAHQIKALSAKINELTEEHSA